MSTEVTKTERLPRLIERAAAALQKATSAAEVLDAKRQADRVYAVAKQISKEAREESRLTKMKDAHDIVIAACQKAMADALVIEAQAKCRLADEYDAAQARGDVQNRGGDRTSSNLPKQKDAPTVEDIGLTYKQVHEARAVRDAEKAKPGTVRKAIDAKLNAGEEPTRADVTRAVETARPKKKNDERVKQDRKPAKPKERRNAEANRQAAAEAVIARKMTLQQAADQYDLGSVQEVKTAVAWKEGYDAGTREASINPLSMTAQEKNAAALRQQTRALDVQFVTRLRDEIKKRLEATILPHYNKTYEQYQAVVKSRKGIMDKSTFRKIWSCLHTERLAQLLGTAHSKLDASLVKRYQEAFNLFSGLELLLLAEKESPTASVKIASSVDELDKQYAAAKAARRAKRDARAMRV